MTLKSLCTTLAALLLAGFCRAADAPALVEWRADLSTTEVRNLYLRHGDSATLCAHLYLRGQPYSPTNAVCYYQTNGMGRVWWSLPCSISSNTVSAAWTPLNDHGAAFNPVVFRIDDAAYRAAAILHLRASPGPEPDAETFILDFGTVAYTNAPWALPSDLPALPLSVADGGTGADTAAGARANLGAASIADATLTERGEFTDWEITAEHETSLQFVQGSGWVPMYEGRQVGIPKGDAGSTNLSWSSSSAPPESGYDITVTRTAKNGYRLGSQADKPLANADDLATHVADATRHITTSEREAWNEKQGSITDLDAIRSGAAAGATAVQPAALAAAALAATNYTDAAILAAAPGNYAAVSNAAMTALQSYTETDPTVPDWAKAANKPTYTASEVGAATPDAVAAAAMSATNYTDLAVAAAEPGNYVAVSNAAMSAQAYTDNALANAGGGPALASNLVARVIAEAGESAAATEVWRIILADHQRRLDAIEHADGTDALTEAQAEELIQARVATTLTNELAEARAAYVSAETAMREAEAVFSYDALAGNYVHIAPTDVEATSYTSTAGASIKLTRNAAVRYYGGGSTALTISSFEGISQNPCWLVLSGYTGVTWPSGAVLLAGGYTSGSTGYFRVFLVYNTAFVQKVYEQ